MDKEKEIEEMARAMSGYSICGFNCRRCSTIENCGAFNRAAKLANAGYGKIIRFADKICSHIAGHSDYHGDNILSAIEVLAEGREIKDVRPLDTRLIEKQAVKEFAEWLKLEFYREFEELIPSIISDKIDERIKELYGEG